MSIPLDTESVRITVTKVDQKTGWLLFNQNATGYFVVNYDPAILMNLLKVIGEMSPLDRQFFYHSAFVLAEQCLLPPKYLNFRFLGCDDFRMLGVIYESLKDEKNLFVWRSVLDDLERCPLLSDDTDESLSSQLIETMVDILPKLKSSDMVFYRLILQVQSLFIQMIIQNQISTAESSTKNDYLRLSAKEW